MLFKEDKVARADAEAIRRGVGFYRWTHDLVEITGKDALEVLQKIYISDISKVAVGRSKYTASLDENGEIIDDVIVNICSVGATHQTSGAAYCASKGAVLAATKNTAFMYMEEGIRCNAVSPGGVVTDIPLVMPPSDEFGFGRTSKLLDFSGELAMPEDLADAILFLASDQSRYVNGEELKCDGGWTCF